MHEPVLWDVKHGRRMSVTKDAAGSHGNDVDVDIILESRLDGNEKEREYIKPSKRKKDFIK